MSERDMIASLEGIVEQLADAIECLAGNHKESARRKVAGCRQALAGLSAEIGHAKGRSA